MDTSAFSKLIEDFRELCDEKLNWLEDTRVRCLDIDSPPDADVLLRLVSPIWETQTQIYQKAGFDTQGLDLFEGRQWVFDAFEAFEADVRTKNRGGVFLVTGPAGCGKSTLLRRWSQMEAQHQGFYFKVKVRTTAQEMVDSIGTQLGELLMAIDGNGKDVIEKDKELSRIKEYAPEDRLQVWIDTIARHAKRPEKLLIFVDAIDETDTAQQAEAVVKCLPKRLPTGVHLILSSRPALPDWDYLKQLKDRYAGAEASFRELPIDLTSDGNKRDVEAFLAKRLSRAADDPQILKLAEHCGYVFLLAAFQAEAILDGQLTLDEAIADSVDWLKLNPKDPLSSYYEKTWNRVMGTDNNDKLRQRKLVGELSRIDPAMIIAYVKAHLAVLGNIGIDIDTVTEWLNIEMFQVEATDVQNLSRLFIWFVEPVSGPANHSKNLTYRIRHKSIRDFLLMPRDGKIHISDVLRWHGKIAAYYLAQSKHTTPSPTWEDVEPYGKKHVVQHLLESLQPLEGSENKYRNPDAWTTAANILTSWDYLGVCLNHPNKWV